MNNVDNMRQQSIGSLQSEIGLTVDDQFRYI